MKPIWYFLLGLLAIIFSPLLTIVVIFSMIADLGKYVWYLFVPRTNVNSPTTTFKTQPKAPQGGTGESEGTGRYFL